MKAYIHILHTVQNKISGTNIYGKNSTPANVQLQEIKPQLWEHQNACFLSTFLHFQILFDLHCQRKYENTQRNNLITIFKHICGFGKCVHGSAVVSLPTVKKVLAPGISKN